MAELTVTGCKLTTAVSSGVVGRAVESALLRQALDAATTGQGGVVFLLGEAGIGESRLIEVIASDAVRSGLTTHVDGTQHVRVTGAQVSRAPL